MKITVLGSGCFGYPLAFCSCEFCTKARKNKGKNIRKRASILINDELLIDLTPDCQTALNLYNKDMSKIKYLLQTHTHNDHFDPNLFSSLDIKYNTKLSQSLNLVCSKLCLEDINKKLKISDKMNLFDNNYLEKIHLKTHIINHGESLSINNYQIKAIYTTHDQEIGAQLYLVKHNGKTLFYATDTPPITQTTIDELAGEKIDCIFLDESFGVREYSFTHLNIKEFINYIQILQNNNLLSDKCKIYATHITHDGNPLHKELKSILNKYNCSVAFDGMQIKL